MKLRCLLIDDEPPALKVMAKYIAAISGLEVVGQCRNAIEALDVLRHKTVDVIFLDIKIPQIIGTEFLKNLSHPPKVIFHDLQLFFQRHLVCFAIVDHVAKQ